MNFENETKNNDLMNTEELPIAQPQVNEVTYFNEPAYEHFDDIFISDLNKNLCFQPASEFDNIYYFNTDTNMFFYD